MTKIHIWLALILTILLVAPLNWYFSNTSLFLVIIGIITKFCLYFLGILVMISFLQYLKDRASYEKQLLEHLKELKSVIDRQEK
ncbi:hypothetical protein COL24_30950 [Bacillus toyonensis]|uniref:hypothetical protein n=1 Tax=Bacillus toyonensis TaxID=155322 RepID=UPI000BF04BD0|nr:hypothetical protein [Bacillus toyonensis]PEL03025.1 hypothetical protein CN606_12785 [Bacillus toyonensis]PEO31033.1 hypothetical protein CN589_07605 [Bacillus toyonensis]PFX35377.1 hypothetical protein COL24_30950 [Bacillus toyonensis]PFX96531.1 hypothetical protein COL45_29490 [Bacillus toyonensis]PGC07828.1 hypothetical protein COL99_28090 [Bacillus toyonensis]